jgi:hypothetical protein
MAASDRPGGAPAIAFTWQRSADVIVTPVVMVGIRFPTLTRGQGRQRGDPFRVLSWLISSHNGTRLRRQAHHGDVEGGTDVADELSVRGRSEQAGASTIGVMDG